MLVASIFFEPREPYRAEIMSATTLRCTLIALVTGFFIVFSEQLTANEQLTLCALCDILGS
jgi:hypothetical protein